MNSSLLVGCLAYLDFWRKKGHTRTLVSLVVLRNLKKGKLEIFLLSKTGKTLAGSLKTRLSAGLVSAVFRGRFFEQLFWCFSVALFWRFSLVVGEGEKRWECGNTAADDDVGAGGDGSGELVAHRQTEMGA